MLFGFSKWHITHMYQKLSNNFKKKNIMRVPIQEIADVVKEVSGVDIFSKNRSSKIIDAKFIAYRLMKDAGYTLNEIRDVFEMKTHASIINGVRKFKIYKLYRSKIYRKSRAKLVPGDNYFERLKFLSNIKITENGCNEIVSIVRKLIEKDLL